MSDSRAPTGNPAPAPLIFGHRGAAGLQPENTLPSFATALEHGVDGVELDVYAAHNALWVVHDASLKRTTGAAGSLTDYTPAQLRTLDAGNGAGIPTLPEVLAMLPATLQINVELKGPGTAAQALEQTRDLDPQALLISSFDHDQLRDYRALGGQGRVGVLLDRWDDGALATAAELSAWSLNLASARTTAARVRRVHAAGFKVLVFTVNTLRSARRLQRMGVDGLFTDRPDRVSRAALTD